MTYCIVIGETSLSRDLDSAAELYTQVSGVKVPEVYNDLRKTMSHYRKNVDDFEHTGQGSKEELYSNIKEYLSDKNINILPVPQQRVDKEYPVIAKEHYEKYKDVFPPMMDGVEEDVERQDNEEEEDEQEQILTDESIQKLEDVRENSSDAEDINDAVDVLSSMYEPFTNDKTSEVLREIAVILIQQDEIDEPTEEELTKYAFKGLVATFAEAQKAQQDAVEAR